MRCVYPGLQIVSPPEQPEEIVKPTFNLDDRPQEDIHEDLCRDLREFRLKHQKLPLFENDFTKLNMKENLMKYSIQRMGEEHNSKLFMNKFRRQNVLERKQQADQVIYEIKKGNLSRQVRFQREKMKLESRCLAILKERNYLRRCLSLITVS